MFGKLKVLTNVRGGGDSKPELSTRPTSGTININAAGASHCGFNEGDYVTVYAAEDGKKYLGKGEAGTESTNAKGKKVVAGRIGSKLAVAKKGTNAGNMSFSSENAYHELGGNAQNIETYSIGDGQDYPQVGTIFELTFVSSTPKNKSTK